jgi:hypothetical protein
MLLQSPYSTCSIIETDVSASNQAPLTTFTTGPLYTRLAKTK